MISKKILIYWREISKLIYKTKIKMVVSENLMKSFDETRECSPEVFDYLKWLWLDPQFEEACRKMVDETHASLSEIQGVKNLLLIEDSHIKDKYSSAIKDELNNAANDEDYNVKNYNILRKKWTCIDVA